MGSSFFLNAWSPYPGPRWLLQFSSFPGQGEEETENGGQATSSQKLDPVGAPFT